MAAGGCRASLGWADEGVRPTRAKESLRTLGDLQRVGRLQSLAKDGAPGGNFGNGVSVDYIAAVGQRVTKRNFNAVRAGFQGETFVADCGRSSVVGDGYDDDGEVEGFFGAVRNLNRAVDSVVVDFWRLKPFEQ